MFIDICVNITYSKLLTLMPRKKCCVVFDIAAETIIDDHFYSRVNLSNISKINNQSIPKKIEVIAIEGVEITKKMLKLSIDIIIFDFRQPNKITRSFVNLCKEKNIFIELQTKDIKKSNDDKVYWFMSLRKILKCGGRKILVISSGAKTADELIDENTVIELLSVIKYKKTQEIIMNSEKCLRKIALKRYCYNNCISCENVENSKLKDDFIWNYHVK